ncbi:hypothetical protein, partial [Streptococcus suis]|uniref:hypothetical protein n=1 Tax=Streptococcus suis TaxID=1307 RepID=UPI001EDFA5E0
TTQTLGKDLEVNVTTKSYHKFSQNYRECLREIVLNRLFHDREQIKGVINHAFYLFVHFTVNRKTIPF